MERVVFSLLSIFFVFSLSACRSAGKSKDISVKWDGYIFTSSGNARVKINFCGRIDGNTGNESLKASSLSIKGDGFEKDVKFDTLDAEHSSNSFIFRTKSADPLYPYGIISISKDYKSISGQLPEQNAIITFYSEGFGAATFSDSKGRS